MDDIYDVVEKGASIISVHVPTHAFPAATSFSIESPASAACVLFTWLGEMIIFRTAGDGAPVVAGSASPVTTTAW